MHEIQNLDGEGKTVAICVTAAICSCFSLRVGKYYMSPDFNRSNYVSGIACKKRMVACGQCVPRTVGVNAFAPGKKTVRKNSGPGKGKKIRLMTTVWMLDKAVGSPVPVQSR